MKKLGLFVLGFVVLLGLPAGYLLMDSDSLRGASYGREHKAGDCVKQGVLEVMDRCEDARCAELRGAAFVRSCLIQTSDEAGRDEICGQPWQLPARAALVKGAWCVAWVGNSDPRCAATVDQVPAICASLP